MKIRTKLGVTYLLLSLLALLFISAFFYVYAKKIITAEVLNHLESVASIQANRVEGVIEQNDERQFVICAPA